MNKVMELKKVKQPSELEENLFTFNFSEDKNGP